MAVGPEVIAKMVGGGNVRNLVFEGGGVWGIAYEGALVELEAHDVLPHVERVAGASAGAIVAALLAVGYQPAELGQVLRTTDFKQFMDDDLGFARDTARLLTEYGWYEGKVFERWVREKLKAKSKAISAELGVKSPRWGKANFGDLDRWQRACAKKGRYLPQLFLVGSNLSKQRREVYGFKGMKRVKVVDAVRRSMSIPLFFACARGRDRDVIVDGGLTWNYPVNLFDHVDYLSEESRGKEVSYTDRAGYVFNTETLGFRLDTSGELKANLKDWANEDVNINNILQYGWALVAFIRAIANKVHLHENDWSRTVFIDVGDEIGFTDFGLTDAQKDFLSQSGRDGMLKFLKWRASAKGIKELERIYSKM